jgi:YgiT-type zinc finger domain-containing protein
MRIIKCLFCGKPTTIHNINAQKKIKGKVITLSNAPVYYCEGCDETYLSSEAQDVFAFIRDKGLESRSIMFDFNQVVKEFDINVNEKNTVYKMKK